MKIERVRAWLGEHGYDGAKSEDTFVTGADGPVPVTNTANWPVVAGGRPAILLV